MYDASNLAVLGGWNTQGAPAPTTFTDSTVLKGLNKLGEKGWEAAATLPNGSSSVLLLLKRPTQ